MRKPHIHLAGLVAFFVIQLRFGLLSKISFRLGLLAIRPCFLALVRNVSLLSLSWANPSFKRDALRRPLIQTLGLSNLQLKKECMNNELDKHDQLDVEISNLRATEEELEKLKNLIVTGLGKNATPLKIMAVSNDVKGSRYQVTFRVLDPKHFNISTVQDWLYEATLVGWAINATFVHP